MALGSTALGVPLATYRVQLGPHLSFEQLAGLLLYFRDLGISHLYLSPCLKAAAGSTHGYDVVDPTEVHPELGGLEGFDRLCAAASALRSISTTSSVGTVAECLALAEQWGWRQPI